MEHREIASLRRGIVQPQMEAEQAMILLPPWLAHGCAIWFQIDAGFQTGGEDQQTRVR
jgi:hypothetical protein